MFGRMNWILEFWVTCFRWEDLILLHIYLQILNDMNVIKAHETF